jgi:hypothetical protein
MSANRICPLRRSLPSSGSILMSKSKLIKIKVMYLNYSGNVQIFIDKKRAKGCYCKVYSDGDNGEKFYRDGYTDITGTFKYALADLDGIKKFSILTITQKGGVINSVKPPSRTGYYVQ